MAGIINSVDTKVELHSDHNDLQGVTGELAVVELEVERIFMGGGSTAEVTVAYPEGERPDDLYNLKDIISDGITLKTVCGQVLPEDLWNEVKDDVTPETIARVAQEDLDLNESDIDEVDRLQAMAQDELIAGVNDHPLDITVDIQVENLNTGDRLDGDQARVFTGHVIGVKESHDGTVTFNAMDSRHYLNKNMVSIDPGENGQYPPNIAQDILSEIGYPPDWSDEADEKYYRRLSLEGSERIHDAWGINSNVTAFEVLRDLARREDAWIYIDEFNNIHFTDTPEFSTWGEPDPSNKTLPPIIEYESGGEEANENVIVESSYDETGLTSFVSLGDKTVSETGTGLFVGDKITDQNVFNRSALEKERDWDLVQKELMTDSGTVQVVGDPRLEPDDQVILTDNIITQFSPISNGTYTAKTIRHIVNGSDGYQTELELGKDLESLYEQFVEVSNNAEEKRRELAQQNEAEEEDEDRAWWEPVVETFTTGTGLPLL